MIFYSMLSGLTLIGAQAEVTLRVSQCEAD